MNSETSNLKFDCILLGSSIYDLWVLMFTPLCVSCTWQILRCAAGGILTGFAKNEAESRWQRKWCKLEFYSRKMENFAAMSSKCSIWNQNLNQHWQWQRIYQSDVLHMCCIRRWKHNNRVRCEVWKCDVAWKSRKRVFPIESRGMEIAHLYLWVQVDIRCGRRPRPRRRTSAAPQSRAIAYATRRAQPHYWTASGLPPARNLASSHF